MRHKILALSILLCPLAPLYAQVGVEIGVPSVSVSFSMPSFPSLEIIPDYPVYYAPSGDLNYFFYDGQYWVYQNDSWYAGTWYNGPWQVIEPVAVPVFILRVPVSYYRQPPSFFAGWAGNEPPRWGDHWGQSWASQRGGWDQWNRQAVPAPAPLPTYQRQYTGSRYPAPAQQVALQKANYHYQPKDTPPAARVTPAATHAASAPRPTPRPAAAPKPAPEPRPAAEPKSAEPKPEAARPQSEPSAKPEPRSESEPMTKPAPKAPASAPARPETPRPAPVEHSQAAPAPAKPETPRPAPVEHPQPAPESKEAVPREPEKKSDDRG